MKIGFVILGYGNYKIFSNCVKLIRKLDAIEECEIIIVDNCSPDGTGEKIQKEFANDNNTHVLLNKKNVGFARGNNSGYIYAREKLKCDLIVVMNSDVFIEDVMFIKKLKEAVKNSPQIAIMGPDITGEMNKHANPYRKEVVSFFEAIKLLVNKGLLLCLLCMGINYTGQYYKRERNITKINNNIYNIIPHGASIIYTPLWVNNEEKAFYPKTFLFCEEYFLFNYAKTKGYTTAYIPELIVKHMGDASINSKHENERKRKIFILKNQIRSIVLYIIFKIRPIANWNKV